VALARLLGREACRLGPVVMGTHYLVVDAHHQR
jgi:hypothetical protein